MSPDQTIAHYRIVAKLGEGGMGEVWRATDTKLGRDVAIKILPYSFADDPDRMARFHREAQLLASLNHPGIAAIYGVEDRALVMELVPGPTLAERIAQGAVPLDEALPLIHQLIDALEYAHERGVVHRDLKPANIKITPEGKLKVLDFGLAKAMSGDSAAGDPRSSPTLSMRATQLGTIMGTAAYMAPEQARGQNVDKRADIWAFGVLVCEMLTGSPPFEGPTVSDTLAAVLTRDFDSRRVPAPAQPLVRACLEKDVRRRLRDIGDGRRLLVETLQPAVAPESARFASPAWVIVSAALVVALAAVSWIAWRATRPIERQLIRFSVDLGPDAMVGSRTTVALSPDGTRVVFPARSPQGALYLATRTLDQPAVTMLPGTEEGADPFFSPDGQWIGFFAAGKLKKISVQGGAAVNLCAAPSARGAAWTEDGFIVFAPNLNSGLQRVPDSGGPPQPLTDPRATHEVTHRWPQVLPGGETILFTGSVSAGDYDAAAIHALSLKTGRITTVQSGGFFGRYLPSGHLIYVHQGTLFAARFDLARLQIRGAALPVQDEIGANSLSGSGQFNFSRTGIFAYLAGKGPSQASILMVDAAGNASPLQNSARIYLTPRFSPDGKRLAFGLNNSGLGELWVYDFDRQTTTQLTFGARLARSPAWTPDGKHIVLAAGGKQGGYDLWWVRSDGVGDPQLILNSEGSLDYPSSFTPDGKRLAYFVDGGQGSFDIWTLPLDTADPDHPKAGRPEPFLHTPASEIQPEFSPDGKWIAYASDENGMNEVYVRPFRPGAAPPGGQWRVSTTGGKAPVWSRDGRRIFYLAGDNRIMVADCTAHGESFEHGTPHRWSDRQFIDVLQSPLRMIDNAPDGRHFVSIGGNSAPQGATHVTFLLNFFDELKRRLP